MTAAPSAAAPDARPFWLDPAQPPTFWWESALTYQAPEPYGYERFARTLEEMERQGLRGLILMLHTHGSLLGSVENSGLCWPAQEPRLRPLVNRWGPNGDECTEFLLRLIRRAHALGIAVALEMKYLGHAGVRVQYPDTTVITRADGREFWEGRAYASAALEAAFRDAHLCWDSPGARAYAADTFRDAVTRYAEADAVLLEHPVYHGGPCYCRWSRERFAADTGQELAGAEPATLEDWFNRRVREEVGALRALVRQLSPRMRFGFYTGYPYAEPGGPAAVQARRGHRPQTFQEAGVDFVLPFAEGRRPDELLLLEGTVASLAPLPCVVHACVRPQPPANYPLPPKDTAYVRRLTEWFVRLRAQQPQVAGLAYYNEVCLPPGHRRAVYEAVAWAQRSLEPAAGQP